MKALKIYIVFKRNFDSPGKSAHIYFVTAHPNTDKWREYGHGKRTALLSEKRDKIFAETPESSPKR